MDSKEAIQNGQTFLGIELGSTRIKAVLIDAACAPIASGGHDWENSLLDGGPVLGKYWSYSLNEVWTGLADCFADLTAAVKQKYGVPLVKISAIGISAMMHGYLVFNKSGQQLVPFRTWRNTMTERAAAELTKLFSFNIPQRWSAAHLFQAMLNKEPHTRDAAFLTTLAGYVHWKLTGNKVIGVGDAAGMFPIDSTINDFDKTMLGKFDRLAADRGYAWKLEDLLPKVLVAGEDAGRLTAEGAKLLDPGGMLQAGIPFCPPEGDAGTGMAATNSVRVRTGNVSAGTSIFAMAVLEKPLSKVYTEIDMVTTPTGAPVAMVHCNNCTTDLDAWVNLFGEAIALAGGKIDKAALYNALYNRALDGAGDCGGIASYNYYGGEVITGVETGRPLLVRLPDSDFSLANFMRAAINGAFATLKIGMDILFEREQVKLDTLMGHGGFFKTKGVGQRLMAAALNTPLAVMESAGEGGAWGIALLAAFLTEGKGQKLEDFLDQRVFAGNAGSRIEPDPKEAAGFAKYLEKYRAGLAVEKAASVAYQ